MKMNNTDPRLQAVAQSIDETTIPEEMASCMVMATAMEVVLTDAVSRIRAMYRAAGISVQGNEILKGLKNYCGAVRTASYWFDREVEPRNVECTLGTYGSAAAYDGFRARCGEVAEVVSMIVQASKDSSAMDEIRDAARRAALDRGLTLDDWKRLRLRTQINPNE